MILAMGILLIGGHFFVLVGIADICATYIPNFGLVVFLALAALSGFVALRLQTKLEAYFIGKHLRKRPDSGWRVVSAGWKRRA